MDIEEIRSRTRQRLDHVMELRPFEEMIRRAEITAANGSATGAHTSFIETLKLPNLSVICKVGDYGNAGDVQAADCVVTGEVEGAVVEGEAEGAAETTTQLAVQEDLDLQDLAYEFEAADADAVMCATDPVWMGGTDIVFLDVRDEVSCPLIRNDYIIDPYQIYESKYLGAEGVLIRSAFLNDDEIKEMLAICEELYMDAIVSARTPEELERVVALGAHIVCAAFDVPAAGSSNETDFIQIRSLVPEDRLLVVASGITSVEAALKARDAGVNAVIPGAFVLQAYEDDALCDVVRGMRD